MPFQRLECVTTKVKDVMASISYRKRGTSTGARAKLPKLTVGVPAAIADQLKLPKDAQFAFMLGSGADAGKARIERVDGGGCAGARTRGALTFQFGYVPALGEDQAEKEFVGVRAVGKDALEIDLPAWFKLEQPQPAKKAA